MKNASNITKISKLLAITFLTTTNLIPIVTSKITFGPRTWPNVLRYRATEYAGSREIFKEISNGAVFDLDSSIESTHVKPADKLQLINKVLQHKQNQLNLMPYDNSITEQVNKLKLYQQHYQQLVNKNQTIFSEVHFADGVCTKMIPYKCTREYKLCHVYYLGVCIKHEKKEMLSTCTRVQKYCCDGFERVFDETENNNSLTNSDSEHHHDGLKDQNDDDNNAQWVDDYYYDNYNSDYDDNLDLDFAIQDEIDWRRIIDGDFDEMFPTDTFTTEERAEAMSELEPNYVELNDTTTPLQCVRKSMCGGSYLHDENSYDFANPDSEKHQIETYGYPYAYNENLICNWHLKAPEGYHVELDLGLVVIEKAEGCLYDKIRVWDEINERIICGFGNPGITKSVGQNLWLKFTSDHTENFRGFRAKYTFVKDEIPDEYIGGCEAPFVWNNCPYECQLTCDDVDPYNPKRRTCYHRDSPDFIPGKSKADCKPGCSCPMHAPILKIDQETGEKICVPADHCYSSNTCGIAPIQDTKRLNNEQTAALKYDDRMFKMHYNKDFNIFGGRRRLPTSTNPVLRRAGYKINNPTSNKLINGWRNFWNQNRAPMESENEFIHNSKPLNIVLKNSLPFQGLEDREMSAHPHQPKTFGPKYPKYGKKYSTKSAKSHGNRAWGGNFGNKNYKTYVPKKPLGGAFPKQMNVHNLFRHNVKRPLKKKPMVKRAKSFGLSKSNSNSGKKPTPNLFNFEVKKFSNDNKNEDSEHSTMSERQFLANELFSKLKNLVGEEIDDIPEEFETRKKRSVDDFDDYFAKMEALYGDYFDEETMFQEEEKEEVKPTFESYNFDIKNPFESGYQPTDPTKKQKLTSNAQLRIQGGEISKKGTWPWMGQLYDDDHLLCGLSLICTNWVLTAAHCFYVPETGHMRLEPSRYRVRLGRNHKKGSIDEAGSQNFVPSRIFSHPKYSAAMNLHDIAIIALPYAARVSDFVRPICLPKALQHIERDNILTKNLMIRPNKRSRDRIEMENIFADDDAKSGQYCWIAGWGRDKTGKSPPTMKEAAIKIRTLDVCQSLYMYFFPQAQMCAGGHHDRDSCVGDSGGPLMCDGKDYSTIDNHETNNIKNRKVWVVQGVTSFGSDCGTFGKPGGYTRINHYIDWIEGIIGKGCSRTYRDFL